MGDDRLTLGTDRAVFSPDRIDLGTRVLLDSAPPPDPTSRVIVDLGAGYGPIACTLARRAPHAEVWAVEVNERARNLCADNARATGCHNLRVVAPEEVPDGLTIDELWSNPPVRIGKDALRRLVSGWLDRLRPTGVAWFVVSRHLGADTLTEWLRQQGYPVHRHGSRKGYRVLRVGPRSTGP